MQKLWLRKYRIERTKACKSQGVRCQEGIQTAKIFIFLMLLENKNVPCDYGSFHGTCKKKTKAKNVSLELETSQFFL